MGVSSQRRSRFERATRSLATFVCSHRSLRSLAPQDSATLHSLCSLAPFTRACSLTSLTPSWDDWREWTRFFSSVETRPKCRHWWQAAHFLAARLLHYHHYGSDRRRHWSRALLFSRQLWATASVSGWCCMGFFTTVPWFVSLVFYLHCSMKVFFRSTMP